MTVAENIGFHLKVKRIPKAERDRRVREAAAVLDLEEYLDRKPAKLSGGQRQRVAMGRAIVREPQVFLMDEPLSNLDAKLRVQTRTQIAALQRRLGVTTVYVTHDQVEAMTMGDRVAVLDQGVLQQCASPKDLFIDPVNLFVAGFIGSPAMNLLAATVGEDGATHGSLTVPLTPEQRERADGGRTVTIGVRPEDWRVEADGGLDVEVRSSRSWVPSRSSTAPTRPPTPSPAAGRRPRRGPQRDEGRRSSCTSCRVPIACTCSTRAPAPGSDQVSEPVFEPSSPARSAVRVGIRRSSTSAAGSVSIPSSPAVVSTTGSGSASPARCRPTRRRRPSSSWSSPARRRRPSSAAEVGRRHGDRRGVVLVGVGDRRGAAPRTTRLRGVSPRGDQVSPPPTMQARATHWFQRNGPSSSAWSMRRPSTQKRPTP